MSSSATTPEPLPAQAPWLFGSTAAALAACFVLLALAHRLRRRALRSAVMLAAGASLLALAAAWLFTFRHQLVS